MIGNRKDEIQRREMMIYFIQIKRFRVFVGSHLVTGQNKNPLQNYDIDIYCISIQGTKKRRRRFFYYGTCWGANLRIHKKNGFYRCFCHQSTSIHLRSPSQKKNIHVDWGQEPTRSHAPAAWQRRRGVLKKGQFWGGGGKYTRTSKGCNLVSQCSLT